MKSLIPYEVITSKIYLIRGKKVMIDRDLSELYGVETRVLNQAVRRNIERFPEDFMFSLTRDEIMRISQIVISLKFSKSVSVFTEQGVAMLSTVLNSKRAIAVNIQIMRAFVWVRKIISGRKGLVKRVEALETITGQHDKQIKNIFEVMKQLSEPPEEPKEKIGFIVRKKGVCPH